MSHFFKSFRNIDWITILLVILLVVIGLAAIYSVDFSRGDGEFLNSKKQLVAAVVGFAMLIILASANYRFLESYASLIYWATVLFLIAVLFFGKTARGTTGWFTFGQFNFQPVELAKFVIILALARYFDARSSLRFSLKSIIQSFLIAAIPAGLIFLQPDFGGGLLILTVWFILLAIFGIKRKHLIILFLASCLLLLVSWLWILAPYQKDRILTFVSPLRDVSGAGYNVRQSIIAIGAGRWLGRGLGFGSQSQLKFLPASQTDFIFAVIAEELGFVVTSLILGIFSFLLWRFLRLSLRTRDDFTSFLILGVVALFFLEFLINVGMNLGVMPVMGIAAPFLSYGGSSLIMHLGMVGVMLGIARRH